MEIKSKINLFLYLIKELKKCKICKDRFGFVPHPLVLDNDKTPPKICYDKWIKKELNYINNKLYIIIGAKAAKVFFPNENYNDLIFKNNYINNKLTIVLPHPSPLNIKWFKDYPEFMEKRIIEVRKIINIILNEKN